MQANKQGGDAKFQPKAQSKGVKGKKASVPASWNDLYMTKQSESAKPPSSMVDDAILSIDEVRPATQAKGRKPKERELTKTHSSWVQSSKQGSSLNELMKTDSGGAYDQFANKKTTYKESLYNTTYDIRKFTKEQIDHAHKIEKEIMQSNSGGNVHVAEERGQVLLRDNEDEEIQYSGVIRKQAKLNNPKRFKCFHKAVVRIPQHGPSQEQNLLNEKGWD